MLEDIGLGRFYLGDCLEVMKEIPEACENLKRRWVCIEKEEPYYTTAVERVRNNGKI